MRLAAFAKKCAQKANSLYKQVLMLSALPKSPAKAGLPQFYTVANRRLPLKLVPHNRTRRLTLRVEAGGHGLRITVPLNADSNEILNFIRKHHIWLEKRLATLPAPDTKNAPSLKNGGFIPLFGIPHRIIHCTGRGVTQLREENGEGQILVYGQEQFLARHIRDFLKKQAEAILTQLVNKHAATLGRKPKAISYKDTKTRWGSCSSEQKLAFSWRIIMAPAGVVDYLAAHEVAHLAEMNHSRRFWDLCEKLCPESKKHRAWLKQNGQKLHAVLFE